MPKVYFGCAFSYTPTSSPFQCKVNCLEDTSKDSCFTNVFLFLHVVWRELTEPWHALTCKSPLQSFRSCLINTDFSERLWKAWGRIKLYCPTDYRWNTDAQDYTVLYYWETWPELRCVEQIVMGELCGFSFICYRKPVEFQLTLSGHG